MILDDEFNLEEKSIELSDKEVFTEIWMNPRLVFKYLEDYNYDKFVVPLLVLAGISRSFDRASARSLGDTLPLFGILITCILIGGMLGWISYYIYAALLNWTGKWLDGQGNTNSILRMLAHAMIPSIVGLIPLFIQIFLFGNGIFQSEFDIYDTGAIQTMLFFFSVGVELILGIWSFVLLVIGLSEIQKFSIGKAIANVLLPIVIIGIPIFAFVLLVT